PPGGSARAHRDAPFWLGHLVPYPLDYWRHFQRRRACYYHQIRLARAWTKDAGAKAVDIKTRCAGRHHFNSAAGKAKGHWPQSGFACPVKNKVGGSCYYAARRLNDLFSLFCHLVLPCLL